MASAEGTDSIELESVFSSKNRDIHSSTLKSSSGIEDGKHFKNLKEKPNFFLPVCLFKKQNVKIMCKIGSKCQFENKTKYIKFNELTAKKIVCNI